MACVVFLRGVNVGGHRRVRPSALAAELAHLDVINIGAAGTFVVRGDVPRAQLRAELTRRLPFRCEIVIVRRREIVALVEREPFARHAARPDVVRFVSVLMRKPRVQPALPLGLPSPRAWLLRVLAREGPFVCGLYRRQMKAIGCLARLDDLFGAPVTTRAWSTIVAVARALDVAAAEP